MTNIDSSLPTPTHTCRPRGRALGFVAGAAFMCVLSAAAGAGAATLITSAQIKDGTIIGADVKNSGLTGADVKNSSITGKDVKNGSLGSGDVKDGSIATADLSTAARADAMAGAIPSGTTVTGLAYFDTQSSATGDFGFMVSLPGRASATLSDSVVNFRRDGNTKMATEEEAGDCDGSAGAPSAPAGQVCVYLVSSTADTASLRAGAPFGMSDNQTFAIRWSDTGADNADVFITAVWAYTAP